MRRIPVVPGLLLVLLRRLHYQIARLIHRPIRSHNVIDYGADPYGILDSTHAIQHTIDNGRSVQVPAGKYITDMRQIIRSNTTICGENPENTIISARSMDKWPEES